MSFSVVMPTYKRDHVIGRAVDSIINQTYEGWELHIVDNHGDSKCEAMFDDDRISYHVYTDIRGDGAGRNYGIGHASGELLCFFDDDDYMCPTYMERFMEVFEDPQVMIARCQMKVGLISRVALGTPQLVVRRRFAKADWVPELCLYNDKMYWGGLLDRNGWSYEGPEFKEIDETLVYTMPNPEGGYREPDTQA